MSKEELSVPAVVGEIYQSALASPKRQRRLLSKTFWGRFGFKARTKERIEQVRTALKQQGLIINIDDATFGTEGRDEWVVLSYVEPSLPTALPDSQCDMPNEKWFEAMGSRNYESEREVEYYFVAPLVESLGYNEDDIAIGFPVEMNEGRQKVRKQADFVLFDGRQRIMKNALLVIEAKKPNGGAKESLRELLLREAASQARGYALWLSTPYYLVTDAEQIELFVSRLAGLPPASIIKFPCSELKQHWETLYKHINKRAAIERKAKLLADSQD